MRKVKFFVIVLLCSGFSGLRGACPKVTSSFSFSKSKSCGSPVTVSFTNSSSGSNQNIASYYWYIDTQLVKSTVGKSNFSHVFSAPGSYTIKLIAKDTGKSGCRDTSSQTLSISAVNPPILSGNGNYSYSPVWENCIGNISVPDTFGLTFKVNDTLKNYSINWGDGSSLATGSALLQTQSLYHKYNTLGQFKVIIIGNNGSCADTLQGLVVNERNPVSGLIGPPTGTSAGCVPVKVRFINNSSPSSPSSKFTWDMGDGNVITMPSSTYHDTFYYTYRKYLCNGVVKLTLTNACGSSFSTWNPIMASSKDSAMINPVNPKNCILSKDFEFQNTSENHFCGTPNPKKYIWTFGDGSGKYVTGSSGPVYKKYSAPGRYKIMLVDSNSCGKDTEIYWLKIDSLPFVKAKAKNTSGCAPLTTQFSDSSVNGFTRLWSFGDGGTDPVSPTNHIYKKGGTFKAYIQIGNVCGYAVDSIIVNVKYRAKAAIQPLAGYHCEPYTANFVNISDIPYPSQTTYKWIFDDGTTSTLKTPPSKVYKKAGSYLVLLVITDSCGPDTAKMYVTVNNNPVVNTSVISTVNCIKSPISLQYQTADSTSVIYWNYGDNKGVKSYTGYKKYTHNYTFDTSKTYYNSIIIIDKNGCRDTEQLNVYLNPLPLVSYTTNVSSGCGPLSVKFTNTSIHGGTGGFSQMNFFWNYNGKKSQATDSTIIFGASKTKDTIYNIKLVAQNVWGCKDSTSGSIRVYPKPLSRFILSKYNGCAPLKISTQNSSIPHDTGSIYIMKFAWNFGNGKAAKSRDSSITFYASKTKDTFYQVSLIAFSEHNCKDTSVKTVQIFPKPRASFVPDYQSGCRPLRISITNTSTPFDTGNISMMSFNWNLGNGDVSWVTNPSTVYNDIYKKDTTYTIRLIATSEHGCKDTSQLVETVHPTPVMKFVSDKYQGCNPLKVNFTESSLNANTFQWILSNKLASTMANPSFTLYGMKLFDSVVNVKLCGKSVYGCNSDTAQANILLYGLPISNFSTNSDSFCYKNKVQFYNNALGAVTYKWDFGDGTTSTASNPLHQFAKNLNPTLYKAYNVSLISTTYRGCKDTFKRTLQVYPWSAPSFSTSVSSGCARLGVQFTNNSQNAQISQWSFGDYGTSSSKNPFHVFENLTLRDTVYHVILNVASPFCSDTISKYIRVFGRSNSYFTASRNDVCDSGYFQFNDASLNAVKVEYQFDDGTKSMSRNPVHLFSTSPYRDTSHKVIMISESMSGCRDTFNQTVTLPQRLILSIRDTAIKTCNPGLVYFPNYSTGPVKYIWEFGDNTISIQKSTWHEYRLPGIYSYALYAMDGNGCIDSIIPKNKITVYDNPVAAFDAVPASGRMPNDVSISFVNKSVSMEPLSYLWNFADPTGVPPFSNFKDVTHIFNDSGNYNVSLSVSNGACSDTVYHMVRIEPPYPIAAFTNDRDSGCAPLNVSFTNNSKNAGRFEWYFGDGSSTAELSPDHEYKYSGIYNVLLVAYGPGGQTNIEKKFLIKVLDKPQANFQVSPVNIFLPDARTFTQNLSANSAKNNWSVYRNYNGELINTSNLSNPEFVFQDTGYFDIQLIAIAASGCTDTMRRNALIFVNPKGLLHIPDAFTPDGDHRNDMFKPATTNVMSEHYLFQIFNRWGEKVFETTDINASWDGRYKNNLCMSGAYIYKVNATLINGEDVLQQGIVNLLR